MSNPNNSKDKNNRAWQQMTEEQRESIRRMLGAPSIPGFGSPGDTGKPAGDYDPLNDPESDEWYLNYIKQYEGTDWYQRLLNNPHLRKNNAAFSPNFGQLAMMAFGDTSAQDNYYGDLLAKRNDYLSKIEDEMRQYKQNSPANQAALMAAAGQNADLLGTSGVAGAPENDNLPEPFKPSEHSGTAGVEALKSFAGIAMQAYQFASGFAHDVVSLGNEFSAAAGTAADTASKYSQLAMDFLKSGIGTPSIRDEGGVKKYVFPDLSLEKLDAYAEDNFRGRWQRKQFKRAVQNAYGTARHEFEKYGLITQAETARKAMASAMGDNIAFGHNYEAPHDNNPIVIVSSGISKAVKEIQDISREASKHVAKYNSNYFHGLDGSLAAQATNDSNKQVHETYEANKGQRTIDKIVNDCISSIVSKLSKAASKGGIEGTLAEGMLLFYSAYRANMLPSLPSIVGKK